MHTQNNNYVFEHFIDDSGNTIIDNPYTGTITRSATYHVIFRLLSTVDVKPDTLNKASQNDENTIRAYIEIPDYDINLIDLSTVILSTTNGRVSAQLSPTIIVGDYDSDGIPDRMVKFDRQSVIGIVDIGNVEVTVSGKIAGEEFEGSDEIIVINPHQTKSKKSPQ